MIGAVTLVHITVLVLVVLVLLLLAQSVDLERVKPLGQAYAFLTSDDGLVRYVRLLFGGKAWGYLRLVYQQLLVKRNVFYQAVYSVMVVSSEVFLIRDVFPLVSALRITIYHVSLLVALMLFVVVCCTSPGRVLPTNVAKYVKKYPYDNVLFSRRKCPTCLLVKPARSHHCSVCNKCVPRYEHHCPWLNNCIGEQNCRWFLLYLLATAWLCFHCCLLCFSVVSDVIQQDGLRDVINNTPRLALNTMLQKTGFALMLGLLTLFLSLVLVLFLVYHLYLVATGTTTNEKFKWRVYRKQHPTATNRYNCGVWNNFYCVFFPNTTPPYLPM